jgi:hypothetical protein
MGRVAFVKVSTLRVNGVVHDVKVYADARHSFLNDHDPAEVSTIFKLLARLSGSNFHEPSAIDARRRIITFLDEHLKPEGRTAGQVRNDTGPPQEGTETNEPHQ